MKYYLIKANDMKKTEFVGEYYFDLQQEPVELTEEELEYMTEYADEYNYKTPDLEKKIRKVLE